MIKVLITYPYNEKKFQEIKSLGYKVIYSSPDEFDLKNVYKDTDILVCNNIFNKINIEKFEKLKWIQLIGMGVDKVPLNYLKSKEIYLTNTKGGFSIAIAEWIISKILEIYKKSRFYYKKQEEKCWEKNKNIREIYDKNILFLGTGSIAKATAQRLNSFDCQLFGINTNGRDIEYFDECYNLENLSEIISKTDINIVTLPLTTKTKEILDFNLMKKTKENSILINVARGKIINQNHLIKLLKEGHFSGVALDIFKKEPLPEDSLLWNMRNVLISPHVSYASENRIDRVFNIIYNNLKRYIKGKPLQNVVDLERGY